ncbi:MAG: protein kinase, partial [Kofleriaceae bacterium]|nr:protein kinase [Kofleriaceae bacterium]
MESCLEDELVYDFVSGQLTPDARSQVDGHLDDCDECRTLVADIARSTEGEHSESASAAESEDRVALARGALVGRYVLVDVLGQGAMGIVFAGYDPALHRKAAIKLLHVGVSDESGHAQERLLREAQAMARLSHPNVVTIYEVGRVDEAVYLAMELVPGDTLGVWLAAPDRSLEEVQNAFGQAAMGLQAAHEAGLVHRDFKPDNVLVSVSGRVQVTDFGLARGDDSVAETIRESSVAAAAVDIEKLSKTITQLGTILGTPLYMAPEQLRGGVATTLSDQYAFCVAYYEALYGRRPFSGSSLSELLSSALDDEITTTSARYSISNQLHAILVRGLAPREQDRFASMAELLLALAELNRPKRRGLIGAAVALCLVGIVGGYLVSASGSDAQVVAPCQGAEAQFDQVWTAEKREQLKTALASPRKNESNVAMLVDSEFGRWRGQWISQHRTTCEATRVSGEQSEALLDLKMGCLTKSLANFSVLSSEVAMLQRGDVVDAADVINALPDISVCLDSESLASRTPPKPEQREEIAELEGGIDQASALLSLGKPALADKLAAELHQRALSTGYEPLIGSTALISARAQRELGTLKDAQDSIDRAILSAVSSG